MTVHIMMKQNKRWAASFAIAYVFYQLQHIFTVSSFVLHYDGRRSLTTIEMGESQEDLEKSNTRSCEQITVEHVNSNRREFLTHSFSAAMGIVMLGYCHDAASAIASGSTEKLNISSTASKQEGMAEYDSSSKATWKEILEKSTKRAISGGKAGASAAVVQVLSLMWLRTTMNYQYRYGGTFQEALSKLYFEEGGIPRLYQGLPFALIQGPLTRFGDTAANAGLLALLSSIDSIPLIVKTAAGSIAAGTWRIVCMPIDTSKTAMQVEGAPGLQKLYSLVLETKSLSPLYQGAVASAAATAAGHFPWFLMFNFLNSVVPPVDSSEELFLSLLRSALIGVCSSCVSDTCSNSLRVIKTTKQTAALSYKDTGDEKKPKGEITYQEAVTLVLEKDGWTGLLGRGLRTRLLTNALQGAMFSVLWKYFETIGGS